MQENFFTLFEEMARYRKQDSISNWLFELEEEVHEAEKKDEHDRRHDIVTLQNLILKKLSLERLVWLAAMFSMIEKGKRKKFSNLSQRIKEELESK